MLADAEVKLSDIYHVVLVGSATRMSAVVDPAVEALAIVFRADSDLSLMG